jgi:hypothetical protein
MRATFRSSLILTVFIILIIFGWGKTSQYKNGNYGAE